jgi:hypothetical protein
MKEDPFLMLMGDAYDGLKEAGEAVTIKAGRRTYYWFYQKIKSLRVPVGRIFATARARWNWTKAPGVTKLRKHRRSQFPPHRHPYPQKA